MAFVLTQFEVEDFHAWKQVFDSDPAGRKQVAKGDRVFRGVDNPNQVFVSTEFGSAKTPSPSSIACLARAS